MVEPGLDRHEWETQWASLEEEFDADPAGSLRAVHELMTRMLRERRILDDTAARDGTDPDRLRTWEAGDDLVRRLDDDLDVEEADIREALANYRELFEALLAERAAP